MEYFSSKYRGSGWEKTATTMPTPALHLSPLRCPCDLGVLKNTV